MEIIKTRDTNQILGSPYEEQINNLRSTGMEYKQICETLWNECGYKCSPATLTRYFQLKKRLGPMAVENVQKQLKETFREEYMDLAGRVAFFNEVILEAKKRFAKEKTTLNLMDLMNLATKMGDSLQRIEGADAQGDLIRQFAELILETKTEARIQKLPIIEIDSDGSSHEIPDS